MLQLIRVQGKCQNDGIWNGSRADGKTGQPHCIQSLCNSLGRGELLYLVKREGGDELEHIRVDLIKDL